MSKPASFPPLLHVALLLNRLSLGLLFLFAGVRKMIPAEGRSVPDMLHGFARRVAEDAPLPHALGLAYGYALPWGELLAGAALVVGFFSRTAAVAIALMLTSFLIAASEGNWWPARGRAFDVNVILLTLAILLAAAGPGACSVDGNVGPRRR